MNHAHKQIALHACCIPVKGARRSLICDLQRSQYYFIPNALYSLLTTYAGHSLAELAAEFKEDFDVILEYVSFIETHDLGRLLSAEEVEQFPPIEQSWVAPERITNAIIEVGEHTTLPLLQKAAKELDALGCKALQIRFSTLSDDLTLVDMVKAFDRSRLRHVDLVGRYDEARYPREMLRALVRDFERVSFITMYNSPFTESVAGENETPLLFYVTTEIDFHLSCGLIDAEFFSVNLDTFTEGRQHNTCLNRKISIDEAGNIKNCPSMQQSFGNIRDSSLQNALDHPEFKRHWNITKDQVETCRDCEFRYICTDCRAFLETPENVLSKPLKCGYDPYTASWETWSEQPAKQKAIEYYRLRDLLSFRSGCATQAVGC